MLVWSGNTSVAQQLQSSFDVGVGGVKLSCSGVGVKSICGLVVARLILDRSDKVKSLTSKTYQGAKVVPDFRDVRIEADCPGICVKCIPILVDLVVENADRAPESRIPSISIDSLLIRLISLGKFLLCHIAAAEQVPALGVLIV